MHLDEYFFKYQVGKNKFPHFALTNHLCDLFGLTCREGSPTPYNVVFNHTQLTPTLNYGLIFQRCF